MNILHRHSGEVIFSSSAASLREAVLEAVAKGVSLAYANLCGANLCGANLCGANLSGSRLRGANLSGANLHDADLSGANLRYANLHDAINVPGKPETDVPNEDIPTIENIHQAVHAAVTAKGCSLNMSKWHTCETTHCRAGWVIHLAGEAGKKLEDRLGTGLAAALIYAKSDPSCKTPWWHASNEDAMADIVECAMEEKNAS